ncbi:hypothetical protein BKA69DRAFT_1067011 [Paraphysoderma sedebokerense]|nr:hypothetical protein BKA69DRAFT_1067011 [Paraphysoderma sedebokerense]
MWHLHGPRRGEPRGYAFVEFERAEDAEKAIAELNGRSLHGRHVVVHFALNSQYEEIKSISSTRRGKIPAHPSTATSSSSSTVSSLRGHSHSSQNTASSTTNIAVAKLTKLAKKSTDGKILELERKLGMGGKSNDRGSGPRGREDRASGSRYSNVGGDGRRHRPY